MEGRYLLAGGGNVMTTEAKRAKAVPAGGTERHHGEPARQEEADAPVANPSQGHEQTVVAASAALERAGRSLQETRYRLEATLAALEERSRRLSMAMAALEQRMQRLAVRSGAAVGSSGVVAHHSMSVPESERDDAALKILTEAERRQLDRENILAALKHTGGKVSGPGGAAELLGLKHTTLASRMKALGIARAVLRR